MAADKRVYRLREGRTAGTYALSDGVEWDASADLRDGEIVTDDRAKIALLGILGAWEEVEAGSSRKPTDSPKTVDDHRPKGE
jgi:hypothetical protein